MKTKYIKNFVVFLTILLALCSCLGTSMDITLQQDGSGRLSIEYQLPSFLEQLGSLDGNQNWPIIPVGKQDFERALARVDGTKLVSYSSREKGDDVIISVTVDFDTIEALLKVIGDSASYSNNSFTFKILDEDELAEVDQFIIDLLKPGTEGKKIEISFTASGKTSSLIVTDGNGRPVNTASLSSLQIVPEGRKVSFSIDTAQIFEQNKGLGLKINW